jgi:hypothetical protein
VHFTFDTVAVTYRAQDATGKLTSSSAAHVVMDFRTEDTPSKESK